MTLHRNQVTRRSWVAPVGGLLLLLVGPPVLLASLVGWPLPHLNDVRDAVTLRWVSPDLARHLGASLAWAAWTYIVACIVVAAVAHLRRRTAVLVLPHALSRYITTTVALILVGTNLGGRLATPATSTLVTAAHSQPSTTTSATSAVPTSVSYDVRPRDTLWDIAERELGDPLRWRDIWHLNAHHTMVDGTEFGDPNLIRPGWQLTMPPTSAPSINQITRPAPKSPTPAAAGPTIPIQTPPPRSAPPSRIAPDIPAPPVTPDHRDSVSPADPGPGMSLPAGLGLGAAAAGITAVLLRRRKAAMHRRPVGMRLPLPTGDLALAERALNNTTIQDSATFLAGSLRLAAMLAPPDTDAVLACTLPTPRQRLLPGPRTPWGDLCSNRQG